MQRLLAALLVLSLPLSAAAQERKEAKDAALGKKETSATPDKSLAGDLTRKKADSKEQAAPALQYDNFRIGVETQVASKRREQIISLQKIIELSAGDAKERPDLLFRLGELYNEEAQFFFFEANRKDDELIKAMNRGDEAAQVRAKAEKAELLEKSKAFGGQVVELYQEIVQKHRDYSRSDEVLFFLGKKLMEAGEDKKALTVYKRLVEKYQKSKYVPDAYFAFGEYYFFNSKAKRDMLEKALENYKKAAAFPDNQVYGFALYKQGWCYFNLADYPSAMDKFKSVVLYGELVGAAAVEKDGGKSGKNSLVREARTDFVRSFERNNGSPTDAKAEFGKLASKPEDRFTMMKQLANLYYENGKDREAAVSYNMLIKEKPLSPEAPGFQGKIVDCVLRAGNKQMTVKQVRMLVKIMNDVKASGVIKEEKDKKALDEAEELSERTLSNLAVNWHNEAKKTRDEQTFFYANEVYNDYLELFPGNPKAYDLRFFWAELLNDNLQKYERAAEEYTKVLLQDVERSEGKVTDPKDGKPMKPGKWMVNASYNAILAYDEVVKAALASGKLKEESAGDGTKKLTIPPEKKNLLLACERYLKYVPQGDKKVEISFKAANIYYRHNYLDEAVERFSKIALETPDYKFEDGQRAGEIAANLVLDSYNLLADWAKVNEWARKFYQNEKLASGEFRAELSKVLEQSSFKLVNQLEAKKQFAKAAEAYLTFVSEFPKSEIADKALYNASIDYFQAKMLDKSIEVRQRIIKDYPKSQFVPACIYANAEVHEAVGDFEEAATAYERYVNGYEKSLADKGAKPQKGKAKRAKQAKGKKGKKGAEPAVAEGDAPKSKQVWEEQKAQVALYNAGVFRDGLGQYKQALKIRDRYLELWPDTKDADALFLSIADLHEKNNAYGKALAQLEEYERRNLKDPNKVLMAEGRIATIYEQKLKKAKDAARINARILKYYDDLPGKTKKSLDNAALDAVAKAHYLSNEEEYRFYASRKLKWGKLPSPDVEFKQTLKEKTESLAQVQRLYTQTVQFKAGDPAICALYKIGLALDNLSETMVNAKMHPSIPEELQQTIRDEMANQAVPIKEKAAEAFATVVAKSQELDLINDCSKSALKLLRETYKPEQYPSMYEDVVGLKSDYVPPAQGGDLLAQIQSAPTLSAEEAEAQKQKAKDVKGELSDLEKELRMAPPKRDVERAPAPKGSDKREDEPEDML